MDDDEEGDPLGRRLTQAFGHTRLYDILGVPSTATTPDLKKGYFRACLLFHPDKQPSDADAAARAEANTKFVLLGEVHALLSDADRRARFDASGTLDEGRGDASADWEQYWRAMFPPVTVEAIEAERLSYQSNVDGAEERDVLAAYEAAEGDMRVVVDEVMCAHEVDIGRFVSDYIEPAIARRQVKRYRALKRFVDAPRVPARPAPAAAAPTPQQQMPNRALSQHNALVAALEAKYGGAVGKAKNKGKSTREPSEEEFTAARARLEKRARKSSKQ